MQGKNMTGLKIKGVWNIFLALLLVIIAAGPLWAAGPQLLHFDDNLPGMGQQETTKHGRNTKAVKIPHSYPVELSADLRILSPASEFELQLPNRSPVIVVHDRKWISKKGQMSWVGHVKGEKTLSRIIFTLGKKAVFGNIRLADGTEYLLRPENGQTLFVIDPYADSETGSCALHAAEAEFVSPSSIAESSTTNTAGVESVSVTTIDLMIVYTDALVAAYPGDALETRLAHLVALANQAYEASEVNQRLRLVHHQLIEDRIQCGGIDGPTSYNCYDDALMALTPDWKAGKWTYVNTIYPEVMTARDQYGADLVSLIWPYDYDLHAGYCGLAWVNGYGGTGDTISVDDNYGYSVVGDGADGGSYCLETTLAHELGHNMGSMHNREITTSVGAYSYSYGYKVDGNFHTIMSYFGTGTSPIDYFSNPDLFCNGIPCGIDEDDPLAANNALSLNNTRAGVASFRATQVWGEASVSPTSHDYGTLIVDQSSDMVFQVTNSGSFQLIIEDVALAGVDVASFILADNQCEGITLQPGQNCEIFVSFAPLTEGVLLASLIISTDDFDTPELSVSLSGQGEAHMTGDLDFDRDVDGLDLALFASAFFGTLPEADLNKDSVFDGVDVGLLATAYGE